MGAVGSTQHTRIRIKKGNLRENSHVIYNTRRVISLESLVAQRYCDNACVILRASASWVAASNSSMVLFNSLSSLFFPFFVLLYAYSRSLVLLFFLFYRPLFFSSLSIYKSLPPIKFKFCKVMNLVYFRLSSISLA